MRQKEKKKTMSIRMIIVLVCTVSIVITVMSTSFLVFFNWLSTSEKMVQKTAEEINSEIGEHVGEFINNPLRINEVNQTYLSSGILNIDDESNREKFFTGALKNQDSVIYSLSYGTENGEYYGARRNEKGDIEIMRNNSETGGYSWYYSVNDDMTAGELVVEAGKFDPRTRDWYKAAKEAGKPVFSPIYKHFVMPDLTVSAAFPVYDENGELEGVLGTHTILSSIDGLLQDITQDHSAYALIIEKDTGLLVANSIQMANFQESDGKVLRSSITELGNKPLAEAYQHYISTNENRFQQETPYGQYYMCFTGFSSSGLDWVVISAVPESALFSDINNSIKATVLIIVLYATLSIFTYLVLSKKLVKPIDHLIETTEIISSGDLSKRVTVMRNDELGKIAKAVNQMADTIHIMVVNLENKVKERTSELESANEALKGSREELRLILDSSAEGIYGVDLEGNCMFCNASCIRLLGYENQAELLGKNMHELIHHSRRDGTAIKPEDCEMLKALRKNIGAHVDDEIFWREDGSTFDAEYYSYPRYKDGELVGAVVTFMDISDRKQNEEWIAYLNGHDPLTGLLNRRSLEEELEKQDTEENLPITIVFADVNGLKLTNDIFGHASGDTLIKKSAEILKRTCRDRDIISRVGGDEFLMLLPNTHASDAEKVIERVKRELAKEKVDAVMCSMSLGYDTKNGSYQDLAHIVINAENRMYKEKALQRKDLGSDMINNIINALYEKSPAAKKRSNAVSDLCVRIGALLNMPETKIKTLREAGRLHDIGKIVMDKDVINKTDPMSEDENQKIQQHPAVGYRILNLFDHTLDLAEAVYSHHENWDGSGYPKGLKGQEIPILARIIAAAEYTESKMNEAGEQHPDKKAVIEGLREEAGKKLDPEIAELLAGLLEKED